MGLEVAAVAAVGVASLVGSLYSANKTNKTNLAISNQTNALNEQMFHESMDYNTAERVASQDYNTGERIAAQDFNRQERIEGQQFLKDMYEDAKEYNSPAAQSQRMLFAGLNPASISDGGSMSPIQSSPTATSSPASSSPASVSQPQAVMSEMKQVYDTRMLNESIGSLVGALDKREDIKAKQINNEFLRERNIVDIQNEKARLANQISSGKLTKSQIKLARKQYNMLDVQEGLLRSQASIESVKAKHSEELMSKTLRSLDDTHQQFVYERSLDDLRKQLMIDENSRSWSKLKGDLSLIASQNKLNFANANLSDKQARKIAHETNRVIWENADFASELSHRNMSRSLTEKLLRQELLQAESDYGNPFNYVGKALGGTFSKAIK